MMEQDKQIVDRIKNLSNEDLLKMLEQDSSNYTPSAWQTALQELLARGGKEILVQKVEKEKKEKNNWIITRDKREKERPKVPLACKALGWFFIIGSLSLMYDYWIKPGAYQYWNQPGAEFTKIVMSVISLFVVTSAFAMLAGNKIGLAVFSSFLLIGGVGLTAGMYFHNKTLSPLSFIIGLLFGLLSFYLFSKWKLFVRIAEYKRGQKSW